MPHSHDAALLPALYEAEARHWWSRGMRAISHALLDEAALPPGPLLEIGCGGGAFLRELARRRPGRTLLGTDLNPVALAHAGQRGSAVFGSDMHHLPMPDASAALLVGLDSFDQQGVRLAEVLREARRVLRPGGLLLLRVSAYDWLRGPHDVAFGTGRRYSARELAEAAVAAGLRVERTSYANSLLLLPAVAVRLAQRGGRASVQSQLDTPGPLSALFLALLQGEAAWLRRAPLPAGLSLYLLARRAE